MKIAASAGEKNLVALGKEERGSCEGGMTDVDRGKERVRRRMCRGSDMVKVKR